VLQMYVHWLVLSIDRKRRQKKNSKCRWQSWIKVTNEQLLFVTLVAKPWHFKLNVAIL